MNFSNIDYDAGDVYCALLSSLEQRVIGLRRHGVLREYVITLSTPAHFKGWLFNNAERLGLDLVLTHITPGAIGDKILSKNMDNSMKQGLELVDYVPPRRSRFREVDPVTRTLRSTLNRCRYAFAEVWETGTQRLHSRFYFPSSLNLLAIQLLDGMEQVFEARPVLTNNVGDIVTLAAKSRRHRKRATPEGPSTTGQPWATTEDKLERLRKLRQGQKQDGKVRVGRIQACQDVGIDPATVRTHAAELWGKWEDCEY